jgi:hypothetical protein
MKDDVEKALPGSTRCNPLGVVLVCTSFLVLCTVVWINSVDFWLFNEPAIDMKAYGSDPTNITEGGSQENVLIVMHDSRSPCKRPVDYHQLAAKINAEYAFRHGYRFLYLQRACPQEYWLTSDKDCTPCSHERHGPRAAPWCKLLGINHSMHHVHPTPEYVVYMDTDAVFFNQSLGVDWIYSLSKGNHTALTLFYNHPWRLFTSRGNEQGCTGIMFWRNTPDARQLLQDWWDFPVTPKYNRQHEYEQKALHEMVEARRYDEDPSLMHVVTLNTFTTESMDPFQYILHMFHPNWKMLLGMDSPSVGVRPRLDRMWDLWMDMYNQGLMMYQNKTQGSENCAQSQL